MTSALFFDVYSVDPPGDSLTFLATLDDAFAKSYQPELNGSGAGQFTINRQSPNASAAILGDGVNVVRLVKVRIPAIQVDPIGCFFLESGDFTLLTSSEKGGEDLKFEGRGGIGYWDRAIWLPTTYTLPWWPPCLTGGPTAGARGAVDVKAGSYRHYTIAGGVITGFANFHTTGFCASYDTSRTYQWPSENNKRYLVHLLDGPYTGYYFHPHQAGVVETKASLGTGTGVTATVKLGDVGATPGAVLRYLFDEATDAARTAHPIPLMTVDFDATDDSDGNPWSTSDALAGLSANVGDLYLQTVGQLLGTGVIDMVMDADLGMHAYNHYGRDLTGAFGAGKVRFERAVNIVERLARRFDDRVVGTFAEVAGTDDTFAEVELPGAAAMVAREIFVNADSNVPATLEAVGLSSLELRLLRGETVEFPIAVGDDEVAGLYTPGPPGSAGHFWLGDLVTLATGTQEPDFNALDFRVTALVLAEDEAGDLTAIVVARTGALSDTGSLATLNPAAFVPGDGDTYFTDDGVNVRFRNPWTNISAEKGQSGEADAYIDLRADVTGQTAAIDIFAYTNEGTIYGEIILELGDIVEIASRSWNAEVDGEDPATAKHRLVGGWGVVFTSGYGTEPDPDAGDSEEGQLRYNETDHSFHYFDGTTWGPLGTGGGMDPGTTLGDIYVWDGAAWTILPAGADGDVLTADSGAAVGLTYAPASGTGFTPVVITAEMNSGNEPGGTARVPWDTFYDVDQVDLSGILPGALGLTYDSGTQSFVADEDGVWVVTVGLDLVAAPGSTGSLTLNVPVYGYGPVVHVAASGNATEWVADRTVPMRTGQAFFLSQTASTALINGYATMEINRIANAVS